jgi:hypothetical protein
MVTFLGSDCPPVVGREWRRRESNPLLLGASEVLIHMSIIPVVAYELRLTEGRTTGL